MKDKDPWRDAVPRVSSWAMAQGTRAMEANELVTGLIEKLIVALDDPMFIESSGSESKHAALAAIKVLANAWFEEEVSGP